VGHSGGTRGKDSARDGARLLKKESSLLLSLSLSLPSMKAPVHRAVAWRAEPTGNRSRWRRRPPSRTRRESKSGKRFGHDSSPLPLLPLRASAGNTPGPVALASGSVARRRSAGIALAPSAVPAGSRCFPTAVVLPRKRSPGEKRAFLPLVIA